MHETFYAGYKRQILNLRQQLSEAKAKLLLVRRKLTLYRTSLAESKRIRREAECREISMSQAFLDASDRTVAAEARALRYAQERDELWARIDGAPIALISQTLTPAFSVLRRIRVEIIPSDIEKLFNYQDSPGQSVQVALVVMPDEAQKG